MWDQLGADRGGAWVPLTRPGRPRRGQSTTRTPVARGRQLACRPGQGEPCATAAQNQLTNSVSDQHSEPRRATRPASSRSLPRGPVTRDRVARDRATRVRPIRLLQRSTPQPTPVRPARRTASTTTQRPTRHPRPLGDLAEEHRDRLCGVAQRVPDALRRVGGGPRLGDDVEDHQRQYEEPDYSVDADHLLRSVTAAPGRDRRDAIGDVSRRHRNTRLFSVQAFRRFRLTSDGRSPAR